ncbi:phosphotransferase [Agrococcus sp. ARC_14]|uniref:phosphotransferase family protein n=1 Tax=Agrococcus sp. ARC_14 TaxID=2919927 RepID=UPI001F058DD7|nr:phosphotransferase [Agrococcus sp. ARC_14]MCH1884039.1 aminoglycoside phosphotransferase family protein [Agrococcus sp. ARC_14]
MEQRLLEQAIGAAGRPVSAEPFGEGRIVRFLVEDGQDRGDWFVDTSRQAVPAETGFVIRDRDGRTIARIWKHPLDPRLPALRTVLDPERLIRIAAAAGSTGEIDGRVLAYRPGRRAVVRLTQHDTHLFVKVVRPGEAEDLAEIHRACRAAGVPAPEVVHWTPAGVVVVRDADGTAGPVAATRMSADDLLDAVDALREQLLRVQTRRIARPSVGTRLAWHLDRLTTALPEREHEIAQLRPALSPHLKRDGQPKAVHGDLHIGQLFFTDGTVSSVIDVDTAGLGDQCDDTAAFIGHATASAVRNEVAGRASDAALLHTLAEVAADRWMQQPHTAALTSLHLIGHAIRAVDRSREAAGLLLDEALDLQRIRRAR